MKANRDAAMADIERQRAAYAYKCVEMVAKNSENINIRDNYKAYVKKLPALIKANGLAGTMAFVYSKKEASAGIGEAYSLIYRQTEDWLKESHIKKILNQEKSTELVQKIINLETENYRVVTRELLALYKWMGRFAQGMIKGDGTNDQI